MVCFKEYSNLQSIFFQHKYYFMSSSANFYLRCFFPGKHNIYLYLFSVLLILLFFPSCNKDDDVYEYMQGLPPISTAFAAEMDPTLVETVEEKDDEY